MILLLGHQIMGSPFLATIGHENHGVIGWAFHDLPGDLHVLLGPHVKILLHGTHRPIKRDVGSFRRLHAKVLALIISRLVFRSHLFGKCRSRKRDSSTKSQRLLGSFECHEPLFTRSGQECHRKALSFHPQLKRFQRLALSSYRWRLPLSAFFTGILRLKTSLNFRSKRSRSSPSANTRTSIIGPLSSM